MNFLPNQNLAEFLKKSFFVEQRFVFVSDDEKKMIDAMMGVETDDNVDKKINVNPEGYISQEVKDIAFKARDDIDFIVDKEGYFGMGRSRKTEKISENPNASLEDLLRDKDDYDSAINGIEIKAEDFEDPLGYKLLGGKDGLPVKTFPGVFGEKVSEKYIALLKISKSLKGQSNGTSIINESIQKYRQEIAEEREEYVKELERERQDVLNKIAEKIEAEKQELDKQVQDFKKICVEPDLLKEHLGNGTEVGFFDYIEKKTKIDNLLKKIHEGKFSDADVVEIAESIKYMKEKNRERRQEIEVIQNLQNNEEERKEVVAELLKGVQGVLSEYRDTDSQFLNPDKAPKSEIERKFVMQLIRFEERLEDKENPINVGEIAFIDDVLTKVNQARKVSNENSDILNIEVPADKSSADMEQELKTGIQRILNSPTPVNPKARDFQNRNQADAKMLLAEVSDANLKRFALGSGQLDKAGKLTGDAELLRKRWLAGKFESLKNVESRQAGIWQSPEEGVSSIGAKLQVQRYLKQIEKAKEPTEVVDKLVKDNHLKILAAQQFEKAYRQTGVTNSYLVIEQTEYNPEISNYVGDDWTIYLDAAFYEKLKRGEGNFERFKARIAHELAHRRFEVEVRKKLEDGGIFENEKWAELKKQFNTLIQGKTVGGDEEGFENDVNVLNELYALSEENKVATIANEPLRKLVEEFSEIAKPILSHSLPDLPKRKLHGTIKETGDDSELEETITEELDTENADEGSLADSLSSSTEKSTEESKKTSELKKNALVQFNEFRDNIKNFGGDLDAIEGNISDKKDESGVMNLSKIPNGPEILQHSIEAYQDLKKSMDEIDSIQLSSLEELNEWFIERNNQFNIIEEIISSNNADKPSYFKELWSNTRFLSVDDVFHMVTESWEFMQRRRTRNSEDARAAVGQKIFKGVPYLDLLSNEYLSKQQKLEQDEVSEYQGNLKNMSHEQIYPLLFSPKNQDHLKAVIGDLCERGRMRWDDHRVWKALGKYSFVKIPNPAKADKDVIYRNEWLKKIVADIWDENTWDGWRKSNDGGLDSALNELKGEADDLHALGGKPVTVKLDAILEASEGNLENFKKGKDGEAIIPSHRYQKYLDYAFEFGKLSMEDKFYYLIAGVRNRVIPIEYFKKIQTERFLVLPILDFFYAQNNNYNDVVKLYDEITKNGGDTTEGRKNGVHIMLMHKVLHDPHARKRIEKIVSRDGVRSVDHDDWQSLMAGVSANDIATLVSKPSGGKATITKASMINGMASYSTFAKAQHTLIRNTEKNGGRYAFNSLASSLGSFVAYDGYLMGRKGKAGYFERLDKNQLLDVPHASGITVSDYQESMYKLIGKIFEKYREYDQSKSSEYSQDYINSIFFNTIDLDPKKLEEEKMKGMENNVDSFTTKINQLSETNAGQKAIKDALAEVSGSMADYAGRDFDYTIKA